MSRNLKPNFFPGRVLNPELLDWQSLEYSSAAHPLMQRNIVTNHSGVTRRGQGRAAAPGAAQERGAKKRNLG